MIVEKQMECRLAGETEVLEEKTCPSATFVHHKIPHYQTRVLNPGRRGGKPTTNRLSYGTTMKNKQNVNYKTLSFHGSGSRVLYSSVDSYQRFRGTCCLLP
jgi:hypothetical protein